MSRHNGKDAGNLGEARLGNVVADADRRRVTFERRLDASIEEVWAALTEPGQLRGWLAETPMFEARPGGRVVIRFDEDDVCEATVLRIEPPRLLELEWRFPGEPLSHLRFELWAEPDSTLLVLDHRGLSTDDIASYGAGWHAHLDRLHTRFSGDVLDWDARYSELLPRYQTLEPGTPASSPGAGEGR